MNNMNLGELMQICGTGLLAAFAMMILRELRKEYSTAVFLGMSVLTLLVILPKIGEVMAFIRELERYADAGYLGVIIRGVGITYLIGAACEICRSVGENGIAGTIETVGRAELLLMCLPLFRDLISMALVI